MSTIRPVFYVSDGTGITAETIGHSLLTQFSGFSFITDRMSFVDDPEKAREACARIQAAGERYQVRPIVVNSCVDQSLSLILADSEPMQPLTRSIERMGRLVSTRLRDVLDAYTASELDRAVAVWQTDDEVDEHYNALFRELLTYMMGDPRTIGACTHLLFMAKNLERIGDHATNIAETVHYEITGEDIVGERPRAQPTAEDSDPTPNISTHTH